MKKRITLLIVLVIPLLVNAQKAYHKLGLGIGFGYAYMKGDLPRVQPKEVYIGNAEYLITPYLVGTAELQVGNMAARELIGHRYFKSRFWAATGNLHLYMGQFLDRFRGPFYHGSAFGKVLQGIYLGAGAGVIKSVQEEIYREEGNEALFRGWDDDRDVVVPLSVGIDNSGFSSRLVAGLRYQYNFGMGDNMDGYAIRGSGLDKYSTVSISLKYRFGRQSAYFH